MRQLHVVALSEDGRSVLLATSKSAKTGGFSLALDAKLAAALRGDLPRPGEQQVRETGVSPKEIQSRLRAGESPEQIAESAGVPVARVERFAGPVLSERERIIDEARAAYVSRNRRGPSLLPLGDAVDAALAETASLRPDSVTWSARRMESGHWLVQVSYVARARARTAAWVYEPHTRSITASDAASAALGHVGDEVSPRGGAKPRPRPAGEKPAARKAAKKAAKKVVKKAAKKVAKRAAPNATATKAGGTAAAKPAARAAKAPAKRPAAAKPAAKSAARPAAKPATKAAPAARRAAAQPTAKRAAPKRTAAKRAARGASAAPAAVQWGPPVEPVEPAGPPTLRVVPAAADASDAAPPEPMQAAPPKRRAAGERAHVPDWADVLLGAAPPRSRSDD